MRLSTFFIVLAGGKIGHILGRVSTPNRPVDFLADSALSVKVYQAVVF